MKTLMAEDSSEDEEEVAADDEPQQEALPLNFGKRLAHTDKVVRDRGFRFFKAWLKKNPNLERLDHLKLWKGLVFGMWMADKRPVQQDLAVKIALLLNDIPHTRQSVWIDCFWETMLATWENLDIHRMSKFMQFARIVVAEAFKVLRVYGWKESEVRSYAQTFTRGVAGMNGGSSITSVGLVFHFTHFFWDELNFQLEQSPKAPPKMIMLMLEPFYEVAENSTNYALVTKINEKLLQLVPADVAPALVERIRVSVANRELEEFHREALAKTAKVFGVTDLEILAKPRESKKARLKRQQKERKDFVALQRKKRKNVTQRDKFTQEFLAKGKRVDDEAAAESQKASPAAKTSGAGVSLESLLKGPFAADKPMSPLTLPRAALVEGGARPKKKRRAAPAEEEEGPGAALEGGAKVKKAGGARPKKKRRAAG